MELPHQILGILFVFGLLGALLWMSRRTGRLRWRGIGFLGRPLDRKTLQTVQRLALTPQHSIHLVRLCGSTMIIATHPQGCTLLREILPTSEENTRGAGA